MKWKRRWRRRPGAGYTRAGSHEYVPSQNPQAILLLSLAVGATGCAGLASGALPPRLTSAEKARLKEAHLQLIVGVETNEFSDLVIRRLRKTNLFTAVDYVGHPPGPPALLAKIEHTPYGRATIPMATLLSFGIIPTTVSEP